MKLLPKIALLSIGVAAVPLAVAGVQSARISQKALREAIEDHELMVAGQVAEYVTSHLGNLHATLRLEPRILDLTRAGNGPPSADLLRAFLQLVYLQHEDFSAIALVDTRGTLLAEPAFQRAPRANSAFGEHEAMDRMDALRIAAATPIRAVLEEGSAVGPIVIAGHQQSPHLVIAAKADPAAAEGRIVTAAVSMKRIADYLAAVSADSDIFVLDREGRIIASGRGVGPARLDRKQLVRTGEGGGLPTKAFIAEYDSGGRRVIGAYAPAASVQMGVVVEKRIEAALSPVRNLGWATVYWISVSGFVAAVVGAALARTLSQRVGALAGGARRIAQGKLETRLDVPSDDELGELAKAFNAMATSLDAARTEILRQTDEILAWNETLERRVEEKTHALREAQDLLLRSRSLAAIGSLGAGVAHEINNPLTGVLGLSQLLLADLPTAHPAHPLVRDIEEQAMRIQQIVANLLRFAQKQSGEDFRALDVARVVDDALELCSPKVLADAGIEVVKQVARPTPLVRGSSVQLQAAFIQLIQNAKGAMEYGGRLTIETAAPEPDLVRVLVSDTGRGIKPEHLPRIFDPFFTTKMQRTDTGIGLSLVHKIIEDHGGTIRVESEPGQGTTFFVTLPVDKGASHLP